jgi:hypothetical protein
MESRMNKDQLKKLEQKIQDSYEKGTTLEEAERLAAEFLHAQIAISEIIKETDLDARMRKSGLKAVRASLYTKIVSAENAKKPTEAAIDAMITSESLVQSEQDELDKAEVERDRLERYYNIFSNAHIFYRGVSKGRVEW